ncbi:LOW QUALITY PROTEIN: uncharacterized protein Z519_02950 [Cladophialophora bantiana CBS 173.52]|uniref:Uncharacterized protein n=1 Tax=Cladophialophora bantiana (strain ATCC 10958 / CBS 173.52 / CDC B-1940 / NIH 8579) TaxID=1442370 RepID=A0A0D2HY72_CLAB1|nr:LOW QUALITY PROTEIN: uncharacterized protein Z519_02950 [Cladophialophora bantiana CBS 173.52]KIW95885.1 LOW QUALITY PROTEIN: hypothetical protein Z519_02950 [Cladophialophora bantiana CBS 173.52]
MDGPMRLITSQQIDAEPAEPLVNSDLISLARSKDVSEIPESTDISIEESQGDGLEATASPVEAQPKVQGQRHRRTFVDFVDLLLNRLGRTVVLTYTYLRSPVQEQKIAVEAYVLKVSAGVQHPNSQQEADNDELHTG